MSAVGNVGNITLSTSIVNINKRGWPNKPANRVALPSADNEERTYPSPDPALTLYSCRVADGRGAGQYKTANYGLLP